MNTVFLLALSWLPAAEPPAGCSCNQAPHQSYFQPISQAMPAKESYSRPGFFARLRDRLFHRSDDASMNMNVPVTAQTFSPNTVYTGYRGDRMQPAPLPNSPSVFRDQVIYPNSNQGPIITTVEPPLN